MTAYLACLDKGFCAFPIASSQARRDELQQSDSMISSQDVHFESLPLLGTHIGYACTLFNEGRILNGWKERLGEFLHLDQTNAHDSSLEKKRVRICACM